MLGLWMAIARDAKQEILVDVEWRQYLAFKSLLRVNQLSE